jgi:uncharacterized membrane protein YdjX (TVP38/TMEM64 family)
MACSNCPPLPIAAPERQAAHLAIADWLHNAATIRRLRLGGTLALAALTLVSYLLLPALRAEVNRATLLLMRGDVAALRDYLLAFGPWAPVVSALLMVLQALIAPLPAFLLAFVNGLAFGTFWGGLLTFGSALLAAAISFWIGRGLGRSAVEALVGGSGLAATDAWFARHGAWAVLAARLAPIVSFDLISYAAGLSAMRFRWFIAATALGIAPATFLYAFLGERAPQLIGVLFVVFGLIIAVAALSAVQRRRQRRRAREHTL